MPVDGLSREGSGASCKNKAPCKNRLMQPIRRMSRNWMTVTRKSLEHELDRGEAVLVPLSLDRR